MEKIASALKAVFEDFDENLLKEDMRLGEIDGWDSMNSVNVILELESLFGVHLEDVSLKDNNSIADVIALLKHHGATV